MYTKQDRNEITDQLKRRRICVWFLAALPALGILINLIFLHKEWLTYLLFVLGGFILVFGLDFFVKPVKKYAIYLDLALNGRKREAGMTFLHFDDDIAVRDGVKVYPLMMSAGNPENEKDDRLFYFDALVPRPDWKSGDLLDITYHDKFIVSWKNAV